MPIPKLVFIDDDEATLRVIRASILFAGFEAFYANNGIEGVDLTSRECPDILFTDAEMPEVDGPAILSALKRDIQTAYIPVVFLTARSRPQDVLRFKSLGAYEVIAKPFSPSSLCAQVYTLLRNICPGKIRDVDVPQMGHHYLETLNEQVSNLRTVLSQLENADESATRRHMRSMFHTFHNLIGSGGTYGYPAISEVAKEAASCVAGYLELGTALPQQAIEKVRRYIDELHSYHPALP